MATPSGTDRRSFLQLGAALGLGAGLSTADRWSIINPVRGDDLALKPDAVRFRPEIEPVVRWIEETPRERILETAAKHLKEGLSYRDLLAGLFLAGIRNVKPRPVGFKFHTVMVMHSAHLLAQTAEVSDRLLPLMWALDTFKNSQAQDVKEGDWTLARVEESKVPDPTKAKAALQAALDAWDSEAADVAVAGLCRSAGAAEVMEVFWRAGLRDQRNIGHKPIFTMQCWRTLQTIGWQHAEPVLRSLTYGILDLQGDTAKAPVGVYEANLGRAKSMRPDWTLGKRDAAATKRFLDTLRSAKPDDAAAEAAKIINGGVAPESLWDAVIMSGGELMMRQPGILALHTVTSTNALHYTYLSSGDDMTRRLAVLQAASWIPMFIERIKPTSAARIDAIEPITPAGPSPVGVEALADIFETLSDDRARAAAKAAGYLAAGGSSESLFRAARRAILHKGRDSHDYKYGAAAWEEHQLAADASSQGPLALGLLMNIPGSRTAESPLMKRAREAVASVTPRV